MKSTALGAENIIFISDAHEKLYYENLQRISTYNVQEVYEKKMSQIATIVNEKKYSELLIICNLKTEITRGVANRYLDSNYETKAVQQIQTNEELKKAIKKKYFK